MTEQNGLERSPSEVFRAMLDGRGVEWWPMHDVENGYHQDRDTEFVIDGKKYTAHEWGGTLNVYGLTPEQAIAATLGPAYEPPVAAHWDGDTLTLTIPRDPSCIRVQRSAEQPCKIYADESKAIAATLGVTGKVSEKDSDAPLSRQDGAGTCKARLYKPEHGSSDCTICECGEINDISANYCNRCGRQIEVVGE